MTSTDHNKVLGILHLIYGLMNLISLLVVLPFILVSIPIMGAGGPEGQVLGAVFLGVALLIGFLTLLFSLPPLIAAYGMMKHKPWARTAGIVAGALAAIGFPLGTALCVYSFWFYFGDGRAYYEGGASAHDWRGALGSAPTSSYGWEAQRSQPRESVYTPPPQPPSWRDE